VVATDPNYAPGHALFAELVWLLSNDPDSYGTIPAATASHLSEEHARAAIRLARNDADGYAALGINQEVDDQIAVPALKRAIALDPSRADTRIWLAIRLTKACRYDEALQLAREAAAIEPLWILPNFDLAVRLAVNGQMTEARQLVRQYGSRIGNAAQYQRLRFAIEARGGDVSTAIAQGEKALALDATVPSVRGELMSLYYVVGLEQLAPKQQQPQSVRIAAPFYRADWPQVQAEIRQSGAGIWQLPDGNVGIFRLAASHEWSALNELYDQRPRRPEQLCFQNLEAAQAMVPALRAAGRTRDAQTVLGCLQNRLAIEARQKFRSWYAYPGDHEYDEATFAALRGDAAAALRSLSEAVRRGWLGRPYSPSLSDRPQFDRLRSDPQLAALQAAIDRRIAQERAQVLSSRSASP
jgi:tetratricopeptide (TPR) repeat protein